MNEDFKEISSRARVQEFRKMNKALEKQMEAELSDPVALELNKPKGDMWHRVILIYRSAVSDGEKLLAKKAKSKETC